MIETIAQKSLEPTNNKQRSLKQAFNKNIDILVDFDEITTDGVQLLNLHQPLTNDADIIEIAKTNHYEESLEVDTNNNNTANVSIGIHEFKIQFPPEKCECEREERQELAQLDNIETQTDFSAPASIETGIADNALITTEASFRKNDKSEASQNVTSLSHLSRPLIIRPILKYTSKHNLGFQLDHSNAKTHNTHQYSFPGSKSSSVSFLLPSEVNSDSEDMTDGKMASDTENVQSKHSLRNDLEHPPEITTDFNTKECIPNLPSASINQFILRMSRPSSFSDSDVSADENTADKNFDPIEKIDKLMQTSFNVEGGRYSILNRDFSSKITEKSEWTKEIEIIRNEIICQKEKCEVDSKNFTRPSEFEVTRKISKTITDNSGYSSGDSTDTLLEEARNYIQVAKEKIVTLDDWKIIEEKKKKFRKR